MSFVPRSRFVADVGKDGNYNKNERDIKAYSAEAELGSATWAKCLSIWSSHLEHVYMP